MRPIEDGSRAESGLPAGKAGADLLEIPQQAVQSDTGCQASSGGAVDDPLHLGEQSGAIAASGRVPR